MRIDGTSLEFCLQWVNIQPKQTTTKLFDFSSAVIENFFAGVVVIVVFVVAVVVVAAVLVVVAVFDVVDDVDVEV